MLSGVTTSVKLTTSEEFAGGKKMRTAEVEVVALPGTIGGCGGVCGTGKKKKQCNVRQTIETTSKLFYWTQNRK